MQGGKKVQDDPVEIMHMAESRCGELTIHYELSIDVKQDDGTTKMVSKKYSKNILIPIKDDDGYYTLKGHEHASLEVFANDMTWFDGYDKFYGQESILTSDLSKIEPAWFEYVDNSMNPLMFKTDLRSILSDQDEIDVIFDDESKRLKCNQNVEYVNNTPEYYEYLSSKVKDEDMKAESLTEEEIESIQNQESLELEELNAMLDESME